jgi:hypothetical protein
MEAGLGIRWRIPTFNRYIYCCAESQEMGRAVRGNGEPVTMRVGEDKFCTVDGESIEGKLTRSVKMYPIEVDDPSQCEVFFESSGIQLSTGAKVALGATGLVALIGGIVAAASLGGPTSESPEEKPPDT